MKFVRLCEMGFLMLGTFSCTRRDVLTPAEAKHEEAWTSFEAGASTDSDDRSKARVDDVEDRIDLRAEQEMSAADDQASIEKERAEEQAERSKFRAELQARLDKVDLRIAEVTPRVDAARGPTKAQAAERMKVVRDQRTALGKSEADVAGAPREKWAPTKTELESNIDTLEGNVEELEQLVWR